MANAARRAANIQSLSAAKAAGGTIAAPSAGQVGGAVTASGEIVGAGGKVLGMASAADRINTAQPTPQEAVATPFTKPEAVPTTPIEPEVTKPQVTPQVASGLNQARAQAVASGQSPYAGNLASADDFAKTYQTAKTMLQGQSPQSGGQAMQKTQEAFTAAQTSVGQATSQLLGFAQESDSIFDSEFTNFDKYFSANNQKTSLLEEYDALSKKLGIDSINAELVNDKKIIEGTEDDIRAEVAAAGGMATESQVQAMAISRNKQLVKNYNALLDTRNNAMTQLSTMMNLTIADREAAQREFDTKMNFAFQVANFKQRATENARASLQNYMSNVLQLGGNPYSAIYNSMTSAYDVAVTEKALGLPSGGLYQAAVMEPKKNYGFMKGDNGIIYRTDPATGTIEAVNGGGQMIDNDGKLLVSTEDARPINKEIVNDDAYKAIKKGQDSLTYITELETKLKKHGSTSAVFDPKRNADLKTSYNAAVLNLKEFFNLGVLNGPDEEIIKSIITDPTNRSNFLRTVSFGIYNPYKSTESGIENMKKMVENTLDDRYQSIVSRYGDYSPESIGALNDVNRVYIEQKASINPEVKRLLEDNPNLSAQEIIQIIAK